MVVFPNAKINLGLRIIDRLPNGYHSIETIFLPISLCEVIEIVPLPEEATADKWFQSGLSIEGTSESNTVLRTVNMLRREGYKIPPISIELLKKIPFGAGLGGGSSDAAFTLKMLNEQFELRLSTEQMATMIAKIGADCSFFIHNEPMLGKGIGNLLTPISLPDFLREANIVLIKPPIFISTKEAYSKVSCHPQAQGTLEKMIQEPVERWQETFINDFEVPLFSTYPLLKELKEYLYSEGADYAAMSGSGSTIYGIFSSNKPSSFTSSLLKNCFVWQGQLL